MRAVFDSYNSMEEIPVFEHLKNRKLFKYFSRETAAAIVGVGKLLGGEELHTKTPFYYTTGLVEHEDFGLKDIFKASRDKNKKYSQKLFVENGMSSVSPLTQFKILYNMTLCIVSIKYNLKGDNAVIYSSTPGLLIQALYSPVDFPILLGAGKIYKDGTVASGFALVSKKEIENSPFLYSTQEAVEIFHYWSKEV